MAWLIITIIAGLAIGGCVVGMIASDPTGDGRFWSAGTAGVTAIVWIVISVAFSIHTVGQRQVGIVYNFSGTITGVKSAGVVMTAPWQHIQKENVGVQREDFSLGDSNAAVSSDQQGIYADLSLNYQVEPRQVLNLYKQVGPSWKAILLDSRVLQDFKEVTSQFTAEQITTKREQLRADTKIRLAAELSKYDISVVDFFVKNLSYTSSYRDAINNKNVQVQQALQAEAKVAQSTAEAKQNVAIARGQAEATLVKAQAEAKALATKGAAIRRNPEVLRLEAIDKLNPAAEVVICSGSGQDNCPAFLPTNAFSGGGGK